MSTRLFILSTCIPEDCEPCIPTVFVCPIAAEAGFKDAMRGEWESNGPEDDDEDRLPFPEELGAEEIHDLIVKSAPEGWGRYKLTEHVVAAGAA